MPTSFAACRDSAGEIGLASIVERHPERHVIGLERVVAALPTGERQGDESRPVAFRGLEEGQACTPRCSTRG